MRYGFEGVLAINLSGDYDEPEWHVLDVAGDVTVDDDSDEIDATTRRSKGVKQTARSLLSRGFSFALESDAEVTPGDPLEAATPLAALVGAARQRQAVCDLAAFDACEVDEETGLVTEGTGIRCLSMIKLTDQQPMGDRWLHELECKPGRVPASATAYAGKKILDLAYALEAA